MQQRPGGARLATEIDVSALDRAELIVTRVREQEQPRKETFNQSWDDCKSLGNLLFETGDQGS